MLHSIILLLNFVRVPFTHGYDWAGHLTYLYYVAEHWRTPPASISPEFFNPPVYYFSVAAFHQYLTGLELGQAGQVFNLLLAMLTLGVLVGLCHSVWHYQIWPTLWWISFYICNPTIYRTFGMVRPEAMLVPLFIISGLIIIKIKLWEQWSIWILCSALLAGIAWGVRQWGIFLEAAFLLWILITYFQNRPTRRWLLVVALSGQFAIFAMLATFFLFLRGGHVLAFNAPRQQIDITFFTRLEILTLFSNPVRPSLNYRFWPVLYADFWGDYWRYWREALGADPLPTSPATYASLSCTMWAALPASGLTLLGFLYQNKKTNNKKNHQYLKLSNFSRLLISFSMVGFLIFASLYANPEKGDTVKSVYIVYLLPFLGYLGSNAVHYLTHTIARKEMVLFVIISIVFMLLFVMPNSIYSPPAHTTEHSWSRPQVTYQLDVTFEETITLVGYKWMLDTSEEQFLLTLVWRSAIYTGTSYKVFVHYVDTVTNQLLAQSDAIPANWTRPTQEWKSGEYIVDTHILRLPSETMSAREIRIGLYDETTGYCLKTTQGKDYWSIELHGKTE